MDSTKGSKGGKTKKKKKVVVFVVLLLILVAEALFFVFVPSGLFSPEREGAIGIHSIKIDQGNNEPWEPLFVGDSRTVGMAQAVGDIDYRAKVGATFEFLKEIEDRILHSGCDCIVVGFGVNDLRSVEDYTDFVNDLVEKTGKPVFFLTVNPVDDYRIAANGYSTRNSKIEEFNSKLRLNQRNYIVIDTNDYLKREGYTTWDGLHYDDETYIRLYNFVISEIERLRHE